MVSDFQKKGLEIEAYGRCVFRSGRVEVGDKRC